ncbi:uncharacterized protein LOC128198387 [Bicyclus anynana]|uniref:Uncharacterized protein LOC128198387 n=1 Tax=Bicyclus anynana TaxID=110368 RepID=A0ABM3LKK8_BICAN|nr:uncharacterized protein LOC128198387 [Bicyclus anynana]
MPKGKRKRKSNEKYADIRKKLRKIEARLDRSTRRRTVSSGPMMLEEKHHYSGSKSSDFLRSNNNPNNNRLISKTLPWKTGLKSETEKPRRSQGHRAALNSSQQRGISDQPAPRTYKYPRQYL